MTRHILEKSSRSCADMLEHKTTLYFGFGISIPNVELTGASGAAAQRPESEANEVERRVGGGES